MAVDSSIAQNKRDYVLGIIAVFLVTVACFSSTLAADPPGKIPVLTYKVINMYPHNPDAFTQGLVIDNGVLFESTGRRGRSSLRRVDLETGTVELIHTLADRFFGEGITVFGDTIIQLTWPEIGRASCRERVASPV